MSIKLANATAQQIARATKKAIQKSPVALQYAIQDSSMLNGKGNLSTNKIAEAILEGSGDMFTKSGKLNDVGRAAFSQRGFKLNMPLKKFARQLVNIAVNDTVDSSALEGIMAAKSKIDTSVAKDVVQKALKQPKGLSDLTKDGAQSFTTAMTKMSNQIKEIAPDVLDKITKKS